MKTLWLMLPLAACATSPTELRQREVVGTFQTNKPAGDVAACVADSFANFGAPLVQDAADSKIVSFNNDGSTVFMVAIEAGGSITVRRANALLPFDQKMRACI